MHTHTPTHEFSKQRLKVIHVAGSRKKHTLNTQIRYSKTTLLTKYLSNAYVSLLHSRMVEKPMEILLFQFILASFYLQGGRRRVTQTHSILALRSIDITHTSVRNFLPMAPIPSFLTIPSNAAYDVRLPMLRRTTNRHHHQNPSSTDSTK